jgi:hypothetical protein
MDIRLGVGLISRVELQPVSCGRGRSPSCPPRIAPLPWESALLDPAGSEIRLYQSDPPRAVLW